MEIAPTLETSTPTKWTEILEIAPGVFFRALYSTQPKEKGIPVSYPTYANSTILLTS